MKNEDGGAAFPIVVGDQMTEGMTLRDYFAAKAMQALVSNIYSHADSDNTKVADTAYAMADAMLAERGK